MHRLVIVASRLLSLPLVRILLATLPPSIFCARRALSFAFLSTLDKAWLAVLVILQTNLLAIGTRCRRTRAVWIVSLAPASAHVATLDFRRAVLVACL